MGSSKYPRGQYLCIYISKPFQDKSIEDTLLILEKYLKVKVYDGDRNKIYNGGAKIRKRGRYLEINLGQEYDIKNFMMGIESEKYKKCTVEVTIEDERGKVMYEMLDCDILSVPKKK